MNPIFTNLTLSRPEPAATDMHRVSRREAGEKNFLRRLVIQSLMRPQGIVITDILADSLAQFLRRTEFIDVDHLRFQTAEPTLDHDIVRPTGLAVHALADA